MISSVRAFAGHPGGYAAYGTSKGAVNLLTKQLATEWAKYNINVNSIAPCIFWTPFGSLRESGGREVPFRYRHMQFPTAGPWFMCRKRRRRRGFLSMNLYG